MNPEQFAQDLLTAATELREYAKARMTSRCVVMRKTGGTVMVNGFKKPEWATVHTSLPVRISGGTGSPQSRRLELGGVSVEVPVRVASFPHDTTNLRDGDLIEITSGDTAGLVLRIVDADPQDQATARRVSVIGTDRPEEWA